MRASNISAPISHLTWRRVAASKNRHLLGNSTTGAVKTTCFYRQNVSYYNYAQYQIAEQLRCRALSWEVSAQLSLARYDFPNQPVSLTDPSQRHRTSVHVTLRGEKRLSKHWSAFAAYNYVRSLSNQAVEQYDANTASAGIEFAF